MKQPIPYRFGQFVYDISEYKDYYPGSIPSSPISSSGNDYDNSPERDTPNSNFTDNIELSPEVTLSSHHNVATVDTIFSNVGLNQTNNDSNQIEMSEEESEDPLKIVYNMLKTERCSFCSRKKYYYDLILIMKSIKDKSNVKICLDCALEKIDDKRKMRDVEFKCSAQNMIEPYKCKKCHACRSIFRFNHNKKNQLQYCWFCAKKKYFTLHKKNHKNNGYVSYLEKRYGDPEKENY